MDSAPMLKVESGPAKGQRLAVGPQGLTVGRQAGNDLAVEDTEASRRHARFDLRDGALVVTDLGSANGTTVNGQPIAGEHRLAPGDVVQIGGSAIRVVGAGARPAFPATTVVAAAPPPLPGAGGRPAVAAPAAGQNRTGLIIAATIGGVIVLCLCLSFALALIANAGGG
jgi:hypothetical protein